MFECLATDVKGRERELDREIFLTQSRRRSDLLVNECPIPRLKVQGFSFKLLFCASVLTNALVLTESELLLHIVCAICEKKNLHVVKKN